LIKWEYKCSTKTRRHKETGEQVETRQWRLQNKRLGGQNKRLFLSCLTMMQMSSRLSQTIQEKLRSPNHGFCWKTLLNIFGEITSSLYSKHQEGNPGTSA
jgi:hypothetical protein